MSIIGTQTSIGTVGQFASIKVLAPTGSVVTCTTPRGVILTGTEVSEVWLFEHLNLYGEYIIQCDTETANVQVDLASEYIRSFKSNPVNYILCTGYQGFNTRIYPSLNTVVKFGYYSTEVLSGDSIIGHVEDGNDSHDYRFFSTSDTTTYFDCGTSRIYGSNILTLNTYYDIEFGNNYIKRNGTTMASGSTITSMNTADQYPILAFLLHSGDTTTNMRGRLYYLLIVKGGTIVFDGKPYKDSSDHGFMYDSISGNKFYSTTGTHFTTG